MNNASMNHFATVPFDIGMSRSRLPRTKRHLTSLNAGLVTPLYCAEVLPGDTVKMSVGSLLRMSTPICPVMDNAFLDLHAYFVPNRLLWSHWEEFMGENKSTHWAQPTTFTIPQITAPTTGGDGSASGSVAGWAKGSLMDYLGLPIKVGNISVSHLPVRAYLKIWNDWYRDENLQDPVDMPTGDTTVVGSNYGLRLTAAEVTAGKAFFEGAEFLSYMDNGNYVTNAKYGGGLLPVCKFHDFFTSCLPSPQKGNAAGFGLLGTLGVKSYDSSTVIPDNVPYLRKDKAFFVSHATPYAWKVGTSYNIGLRATTQSGSTTSAGSYYATDASADDAVGGGIQNRIDVYRSEYVDLGEASMVTVNALREAFALQRYFEKLARGGSRYTEIIKSFFGVQSPDARLQRSEFLGGKRVPINMTQVAQTTPNSGGTGVGALGAFSQTIDGVDMFTHSFVEHGYLMILGMIRTERSYQQGIPKHFSRTKFSDFYLPTFANLGEMPVLRKEIYATGVAASDDAVFGFQEAWAEYRYDPNQISGELRSTYAAPLDMWHYGDKYGSAPTLSSAWIREPQVNVERTLAVANQDQFIGDFQFDSVWARVMPVYSIPGLIDHH